MVQTVAGSANSSRCACGSRCRALGLPSSRTGMVWLGLTQGAGRLPFHHLANDYVNIHVNVKDNTNANVNVNFKAVNAYGNLT